MLGGPLGAPLGATTLLKGYDQEKHTLGTVGAILEAACKDPAAVALSTKANFQIEKIWRQ